MVRIGVIDIGTNSVRLLIADVDSSQVMSVYRGLSSTRLGQGIEGGLLLPEAVSRTIQAIADMQEICRKNQVEETVAIATSAVRDADNKEWFVERAYIEAGVRVRVLQGEEEAYYSFMGATAGFTDNLDGAVIVDIGGGSTELTWKQNGRIISRSVNAGAVRMTERGYDCRYIAEVLKPVLNEIIEKRPQQIIGTGGTITSLAAMDMKLEPYDWKKVHGYLLYTKKVEFLFNEILRLGHEDRKNMPGLHPDRADIIIAGINILKEIVNNLKFDFIRVSEADLMYALALEAACCRNKLSHK